VLYYLAENLAARADEFARRIEAQCEVSKADARKEVDASVDRLFGYGAWADKFEGRIHVPPMRGLALAVHEAIGVVGVVCENDLPLLGFVSAVAPLIAMGSRVVAVPSETAPLSATDFYQVMETSDVPAGAVNIVTGKRAVLAKTLAEHMDVDAMWHFGDAAGAVSMEKASAGNLKRTFTDRGRAIDWFDRVAGEGPLLLRHAVQVKNIWIPYGE
jgi:aldehyde dehydrogenase (NAD+)